MRKLGRHEVNRKLLHVLSGTLIPGGIFYLPRVPGVPQPAPVVLLGVLLAAALVVEAMRFRVEWVHRSFHAAAAGALRPEEHHRVTGATYIFASGFICALVFYRAPHIAFMALSMFILGDAAAALVGQSVGRIRIGGKTLEGTLGCLAVCLVLCLAVYPGLPWLLDEWNGRMSWALAVVASVCTSLLELFPLRISRTVALNDNLTVPVITGLVMLWLHPLALRAGW